MAGTVRTTRAAVIIFPVFIAFGSTRWSNLLMQNSNLTWTASAVTRPRQSANVSGISGRSTYVITVCLGDELSMVISYHHGHTAKWRFVATNEVRTHWQEVRHTPLAAASKRVTTLKLSSESCNSARSVVQAGTRRQNAGVPVQSRVQTAPDDAPRPRTTAPTGGVLDFGSLPTDGARRSLCTASRRRDVVQDRLDEVRGSGADAIVAHRCHSQCRWRRRRRTVSRCRSDHSRNRSWVATGPGGTGTRGISPRGGLRAPIHQ